MGLSLKRLKGPVILDLLLLNLFWRFKMNSGISSDMYSKIMDELSEALKQYEETNPDYYINTLKEMDKLLKRYLESIEQEIQDSKNDK